jgi:trigger factor
MLVGVVARGMALALVVEAATVKDTNGEIVDLDDEEESEEPAEASTDASAEPTEAPEEKPEA